MLTLDNVQNLLNYVLFYTYNVGLHEEALVDADAALTLLLLNAPSDNTHALSNIYHRKAQAQSSLGQVVPALKTYKAGLAACPGAAGLAAGARLALDDAPATWFAAYWAKMVDAAQQPHPLSAREGKLLKLVPMQHRLNESELRPLLTDFLLHSCARLEDARDTVWSMWKEGRSPGRGEVAFFRAAAYLQSENAEQAQRDSRVAITYSKAKDSKGNPTWAAPFLVQSSALEKQGDNVSALIHAARAAELDPDWTDATEAVERLVRRVPEHYAEAVQSGGVSRLHAVLDAEKERNLPPFMKPKPKYYYYYEWMRRRIEARHQNLPESVMDKLLTLDATELDLLMQYPAAIDGTVAALEGVLMESGEEALATWTVPLLSWEKKQELEEQQQQQQQLLEGSGQSKNLLLEASSASAVVR